MHKCSYCKQDGWELTEWDALQRRIRSSDRDTQPLPLQVYVDDLRDYICADCRNSYQTIMLRSNIRRGTNYAYTDPSRYWPRGRTLSANGKAH